MNRRLWIWPCLVALLLPSVAPAADKAPPPPPEVFWQPFDSLIPYDRDLAEQALAPMWGDDPSLWPDWLDGRAALLPGRSGEVMVVREPLRAPCGDYAFFVFGPYQPPDGGRASLGNAFCADGIVVQPHRGQSIPDLILKNTGVPDGDTVRVRDQQVHWSGKEWTEVKIKPESPATKPSTPQ